MASIHAEAVTAAANIVLKPYLDKILRLPQVTAKSSQGTKNQGAPERRCVNAHSFHYWECGLNENTRGLHGNTLTKGADLRI